MQVDTVSADSVVIKWQRPLVSNGPISYYRVCYTINGSSEQTCSSTTTTKSRFANLKPFSSYLIIVRAVNVEGATKLESKWSTQIQFRTLSSSELAICTRKCTQTTFISICT